MPQRATLAPGGPVRADLTARDKIILCGIHVAVSRVAAVRTTMHTNAQVLLDNRPTSRAHLRGVGGVHGHHWRTGTLSLVRQQVSELR